jgi:sporulation protein YlmC with PRC-barrel domain
MYERQGGHAGQEEHDYYVERPMDLKPLGELREWHVDDESLDVRGWTVVDLDGARIGRVDDLVVDINSGDVIFLIAGYGGTLGIGGTKTLVPVDQVAIDTERELVEENEENQVILLITPDHIYNAPKFQPDRPDYELFYDYWGGFKGTTGVEQEDQEMVKRGKRVDVGYIGEGEFDEDMEDEE